MNQDLTNLLLALAAPVSVGYLVFCFYSARKAWKKANSEGDEFFFERASEKHAELLQGTDDAPDRFPAQVRSSSDPGTVYGLDQAQCRCTCPDWNKRRGGFPVGDPRRMCKHLVRLWCERRDGFPAHLSWYADEFRFRYGTGTGFNPHAARQDLVLPDGGAVEVYRDDQKEWIEVFDGEKHYGFNPELMKWAYDNTPRQSREIIKGILGVGPDLLPGSVKTLSRRPATENDQFTPFNNRSLKGCSLVAAEVEGVTVTALINPRAGWQNMLVDGMEVDVDLREGRFNSPPQLMHLELALSAWAKDERDIAKAALKGDPKP